MAIARGAGTEIIRTHHFEAVDDVAEKLIFGVQHHIYTVLSVVFYCVARSGTEDGHFKLIGYDSNGGTSGQDINISLVSCAAEETFVWNDKFSFNGYEPVDFTGPMSTAAKQDAIADQGSGYNQYLSFITDGGATTYDITVTFIDQNNA